jgi:uncharacterized membrane protein YkoI
MVSPQRLALTPQGGDMKRFGMMTAIASAALLSMSLPAWSDEKEDGKPAELVKSAKVTIDQAIKTASEKVQGTVIEAELEKKHDKVIWEVEVYAADGKVSEVHVDADSGAVIDVEDKKEKKKEGKKKK